MIRALRTESHAEGHFSVRPNLAFKGLNREDFVLEKHLVFFYSFLDRAVFAVESD